MLVMCARADHMSISDSKVVLCLADSATVCMYSTLDSLVSFKIRFNVALLRLSCLLMADRRGLSALIGGISAGLICNAFYTSSKEQ